MFFDMVEIILEENPIFLRLIYTLAAGKICAHPFFYTIVQRVVELHNIKGDINWTAR